MKEGDDTVHYLLSEQLHVLVEKSEEGAHPAQALAYLLRGGQNVLVDLLPGGAGLTAMLGALLPLSALDAMILSRWDEAWGPALGELLAAAPGLEIYCSPRCAALLEAGRPGIRCRAVASGERLKLGEHEFHFTHTPGLPGGESMVAYEERTCTLFSGALFGQLVAGEPPLDTQCPPQKLISLAADYFDAVLSAATAEQRQVLFDLADPDLERVAPGCGLVLQDGLDDVFGYYELLCRQG